MSEPDAKLRQLAAAEHGLGQEAAELLVGSTLGELDESAAALERLLEERREQEPEPPTDFFAAAAAAKAERQRAFMAALTGRASQPRDERGRFAGTGFDGGARQPVPPAPPTHDEWLVDALRDGRANAGGHF